VKPAEAVAAPSTTGGLFFAPAKPSAESVFTKNEAAKLDEPKKEEPKPSFSSGFGSAPPEKTAEPQ
jgi:hypothetical protein